MAKSETAISFNLPKGKLHRCIISGKPYENSAGKEKYISSVLLSGDDADALIEKIDAFWAEHKPKGFKGDPMLGYRPFTEFKGNLDEEGEKIYEPVEGVTEFYCSTGAAWPDGSVRVVQVYNSKGNKVNLGEKKIGNGSEGRIAVTMDVYGPFGKGVNASAGVSLYLQGLQITKFVEYIAGPSFDEDDDDDGFEGFDDDFPTESESDEPAAGKPRI